MKDNNENKNCVNASTVASGRTVLCSRYRQELPGLDKPPMRGSVGERIFENVSKKAWDEWRTDLQIKVLNEYRLNMADKNDYQFLVTQMLRYLNLESGEAVDVGSVARGRDNN
jgi:Fe-S cluster biosynthesis and repair protein YggX